MRYWRDALRAWISKCGYSIVRDSSVFVRFENFENLARAYAYMLERPNGEVPIPESAVRPRLLARLIGTPPSEAFAIVQALAKTNMVEGDVCEFGVACGETSALIASEIAATRKRLHLFDSFEGLPKPTEKDRLKDDIFALGSIDAYAGRMASPEHMVAARLKAVEFPRDRVVIHKGFIEQVIGVDGTLPERVSFAYVDFDFYEPIKVALEFLHEVTERGAIVIVDDYDFFSTGAKTAVDEFVADKNAAEPRYDMVVPDIELGHFAVLTRIG